MNTKINSLIKKLGHDPQSPTLRYLIAVEYLSKEVFFELLVSDEIEFWRTLYLSTSIDRSLRSVIKFIPLPGFADADVSKALPELRLAHALGPSGILETAKTSLLFVLLERIYSLKGSKFLNTEQTVADLEKDWL